MKLRLLPLLLLLGLPLAAQTTLTTPIPNQKLVEVKNYKTTGVSAERLERLDGFQVNYIQEH